MIRSLDGGSARPAARFRAPGEEGEPGAHPTPEALSAYHAGELAPREADAIQEHLVACDLCSGLLLDLERFLEPQRVGSEELGPAVADFGAESGWRGLRQELKLSRPGPEQEISRLKRTIRRLQALAAALLVATLGFAAYTLQPRPELGMNLVPSFPSNLLKKRGDRERRVERLRVLPGDAVVFSLYDLRGIARDYKVEIRSPREELVWSRADLPRRGEALLFLVPSRVLTPGFYRILVSTKDGMAGEYSIEVLN